MSDEKAAAAVKSSPAEIVPIRSMRHDLKVIFSPAENKLVIAGILTAATELEHEHLAALLDEDDPPDVKLRFTNESDVVNVALTFEHQTKNVGAEGHATLKVRHAAAAAGMTVPAFVKMQADQKKMQEEAERKAKKNDKSPN